MTDEPDFLKKQLNLIKNGIEGDPCAHLNQLKGNLVAAQRHLEHCYYAIGEEERRLMSVCEHDWEFTGRGHSKDRYTCTKCGKSSWQ